MRILVQVNRLVKVTRSRTFLDLIFPKQVSLGKEKGFGKRAVLLTLTNMYRRKYTCVFFACEMCPQQGELSTMYAFVGPYE